MRASALFLREQNTYPVQGAAGCLVRRLVGVILVSSQRGGGGGGGQLGLGCTRSASTQARAVPSLYSQVVESMDSGPNPAC